MTAPAQLLPTDPRRPSFDALGGALGQRTNFIHLALVAADEPLAAVDVGTRAQEIAKAEGMSFNASTYSPQVTRNHLITMRERGLVEQVAGKKWQLTEYARQRIEGVGIGTGPAARVEHTPPPASQHDDLRTVDDKSRLLLPRRFANATVTITEVSDTELRIQKAVVVPESALPLMEDALQPLSDRDRDLFLDLLENPPEPNAAFRKAAEAYKERHG